MASKMLIDAAHPEETRVVVVKGSRVEEFDYESANKKQLRGNIYLAKVTRVEPSLQAAFVDYGGNRHGFLAFSEIHPDYYQIPVADRQALLEEEAAEHNRASAEEAAEDDDAAGGRRGRDRRGRGRNDTRKEAPRADAAAPEEVATDAAAAVETASEMPVVAKFEIDAEDEIDTTPRDDSSGKVIEASSDLVSEVSEPAEPTDDVTVEAKEVVAKVDVDDEASPAPKDGEADAVESVGSEDALEEVPERGRRRRSRSYKIQEVIRRRQIILVQVVKEERGNKGAALTTYLSLAGRYTVLMPNTARGGGISRKINQATDRKRLREIAGELEVPEGMGLIIRTAGAQRTKTEVKRDYDYLLRLWETVRDLTLGSTAPALVYEEGSLIKRSIRDLYNKDIDEVLVAGDDAHREAKDFMRMLMPSHAKNVKAYKEPEPVFIRHQVERQLAAMFSPQVVLRSGGYIVINQTEALVSVDVNSGKATREHNIEDTALTTNLEASEELARQLRLRDLAGLIVIDFIDMDERRNNRLVERRLKDSLHNDRARIQIGRISHFGLLEMSRQRLRPGMLEGSTTACSMCQGTGIVRSVESVALDILRSAEDRLITDGVVPLVATTAVDVAIYILNQKRAHLRDIEDRYQISVTITADKDMHISQYGIERAAEGSLSDGDSSVIQMDWAHHRDGTPAAPADEAEGEQGKRRSRRRRRRRPDEDGAQDDRQASASTDSETSDESTESEDGTVTATEADGETTPRRSPRRRGRRGGRRGRGGRSREANAEATAEGGGEPSEAGVAASETPASEPLASETSAPEAPAEDRPAPRRRRSAGRSRAKSTDTAPEARETEPALAVASVSEAPAPAKSAPVKSVPVKSAPAPEVSAEASADTEATPRRKGWWSRG